MALKMRLLADKLEPRLVLVLSVVTLAGCAAKARVAVDPTVVAAVKDAVPDVSHIMALFNRYSAAHACPVSANLVLTNAHVMDVHRDLPFQASRWSDEAGAAGWLAPIATISASDLAMMRPTDDLGKWYDIAASAPEIAETLWLVEYSWASEDKAYQSKTLKVQVLRVVAGNIVYKPVSKPGSSGGCLLNAASEVVGIVAWGTALGVGEEVGVAVGIWDEWLDLDYLAKQGKN